MAIQAAARFKPDTYKSQLEAITANLDPAATPPSGTRYFPVQIVAYNDARFDAATYDEGDPATERRLRVLHTDTLPVEIAVYAGRTIAQIEADLAAKLDEWALGVKPAILTLARLSAAASQIGLRPIP